MHRLRALTLHARSWDSGRMGRLSRSPVAAVAYAALALLGFCGTAPAATPSGFSIVPAAIPSGATSGQLRAVSALGPANVWTVGSYVHDGRTDPLIEHWNGTSWHVVPSGYAMPESAALTSVSVRGAKDVWAAGLRGGAPMVMHWDGSAWSIEPTPLQTHLETNNIAIAAVPAGGVWVASGQSGQLADIEHRVDGVWMTVTPPPVPGATGVQINDIAATGASNVWFAGTASVSQHELPVVYHWDGAAMSVRYDVLVPPPNGDIAAWGIATSGSSSALVVGSEFGGSQSIGQPRSASWNGSSWMRWDLPAYSSSHGFNDVAALSPGRAWAVGSRKATSGVGLRTFIARWDMVGGVGAWTDLGGPNVAGTGNQLFGLTHVPNTTSLMWAVGAAGGKPLILRHAG
jgi:hypothetical protein